MVVHDLGGPIWSLWAVRNTNKIRKFVILDTFLYPEPSFWVKLSLLPAKIPGIRYWLVSPSGIETMMKWGISRKKVITDELISAYQTPFDSVEARQVLLKIFNSFQFDELKEVIQKLPALSVPISIVYGEKDSLLAPEMRRLKKDMPNALCTIIPDSGHFIQEDQPEKLSELLVEFLSE